MGEWENNMSVGFVLGGEKGGGRKSLVGGGINESDKIEEYSNLKCFVCE